MKIEDQVCSLELSKKLQSLNIVNKSIFVWEFFNDNCYDVKFIPYAVVPDEYNQIKIYPAFTASELMDILPIHIDINQHMPFNNFRFDMTMAHIFIDNELKKSYMINYRCDTIQPPEIISRVLLTHNVYDEDLANCLAKTLIYLIEEKFINVSKSE